MRLCPLSLRCNLRPLEMALSAGVFIHWGCRHPNTAGDGSRQTFRRREGPGPGVSRVAPPEALSLALSPPRPRTPVRWGQGHLTACFPPLHRPCLQNPEWQDFSTRILSILVQPQQEAEQDHSGVGKGETSAEVTSLSREGRSRERGLVSHVSFLFTRDTALVTGAPGGSALAAQSGKGPPAPLWRPRCVLLASDLASVNSHWTSPESRMQRPGGRSLLPHRLPSGSSPTVPTNAGSRPCLGGTPAPDPFSATRGQQTTLSTDFSPKGT